MSNKQEIAKIILILLIPILSKITTVLFSKVRPNKLML